MRGCTQSEVGSATHSYKHLAARANFGRENQPVAQLQVKTTTLPSNWVALRLRPLVQVTVGNIFQFLKLFNPLIFIALL